MALDICQESLNLIDQNKQLSIDRILFLAHKKDLDGIFIANQIKGRIKCAQKIPDWLNQNLIFPNSISMEQCSSQKAAIYKSELVKGKTLADLTGGFGVDAYFLSKSFNKTSYCETNKKLHDIVNHNFKSLKSTIETHAINGIDFLKKHNTKFDCIYLDPSRRNNNKERVHQLEEYSPNVIDNIDLLFSKSSLLFIKTSPFLEPKEVISKLPHVKEIHVVSIKNDCKEVLYIAQKGFEGPIHIHAIDLEKPNKFSFYLEQEEIKCGLSKPLKYLYEPNSAILKAGAYQSIANKFGLLKLNQNSHLYTSEKAVENFPGRRFEIIATTNYNYKNVAHFIKENKANISKRNFPYSVQEIRKKLKLTDGGQDYIFATTLTDNSKAIIICRKY